MAKTKKAKTKRCGNGSKKKRGVKFSLFKWKVNRGLFNRQGQKK
jgi:hypothetical protein